MGSQLLLALSCLGVAFLRHLSKCGVVYDTWIGYYMTTAPKIASILHGISLRRPGGSMPYGDAYAVLYLELAYLPVAPFGMKTSWATGSDDPSRPIPNEPIPCSTMPGGLWSDATHGGLGGACPPCRLVVACYPCSEFSRDAVGTCLSYSLHAAAHYCPIPLRDWGAHSVFAMDWRSSCVRRLIQVQAPKDGHPNSSGAMLVACSWQHMIVVWQVFVAVVGPSNFREKGSVSSVGSSIRSCF